VQYGVDTGKGKVQNNISIYSMHSGIGQFKYWVNAKLVSAF